MLGKDGFTIWASPDLVQTAEGTIRVGQTCRVWSGKEQRHTTRGFYVAVGDAYDEAAEDSSAAPLLRYYWHLTSDTAVPFVAAATRLLNAAGVAFRLKVLADPAAFRRADAGVILLSRCAHTRIGDAIARLHEAVRPDCGKACRSLPSDSPPGWRRPRDHFRNGASASIAASWRPDTLACVSAQRAQPRSARPDWLPSMLRTGSIRKSPISA